MKVFSVIMMLIILGLHLTPCSDTVAMHEPHEVTAFQQLSSSASHAHATHPDACSPFCHCACCTTSTIVESVAQLSSSCSSYKPIRTEPVPSSLIAVYLPIWQPPQLVA